MNNQSNGRADNADQTASWPPALREEQDQSVQGAARLDLASDVFPSRCVRDIDAAGRPLK